LKIQIKQPEIMAGIKLYLASQGIDLAGKAVLIEFTAGRKESGLYADIDISNYTPIPGFDDVRPTLTVVPTAPADAPVEVEPVPVPEEAAPAAETPAKTTSLFG
jgi:hypothetical protein